MSEPLWARSAAPAIDTVIWRAAPAAPADLTILRRQLRDVLDARNGPDAGSEEVQWLLLAADELASNGLRHGRLPVEVVVFETGRAWLLDVSDTAPDRPPIPAVGRDPADGGFGLFMVARLGSAHGWTTNGARKHVWVRIDWPLDAARAAVDGVRRRSSTDVSTVYETDSEARTLSLEQDESSLSD